MYFRMWGLGRLFSFARPLVVLSYGEHGRFSYAHVVSYRVLLSFLPLFPPHGSSARQLEASSQRTRTNQATNPSPLTFPVPDGREVVTASALPSPPTANPPVVGYTRGYPLANPPAEREK